MVVESSPKNWLVTFSGLQPIALKGLTNADTVEGMSSSPSSSSSWLSTTS